jgi:spore maturation protein CgeB
MSDSRITATSPLNVTFIEGKLGHMTVKVRGENGADVLLHSLYDPHREAAGYIPEKLSHDTVVFLGSGLGYHIPLTLERHPGISRIIIVELYEELAKAAVASITDLDVKIEILTVSTGSSIRLPDIPSSLYAGNLHIISHPPSISANPEWYSRCHALLATAGTADLTSRVKKKENLTILFLYGAYYCQKESIQALGELGHRVLVLDYREKEKNIIDVYHEILLENQPDLVISINMRGLDSRGVMSEILAGMGIPLALWFVDSPEFILYGETLPAPAMTRVFLWDKSYLPAVESLGYAVEYLPLAATPGLIERAVSSLRFKSDVSFVGNSLCSGFLSRLSVKFPRTRETMKLADESIEEIIVSRGNQLERLDEILSAQSHLLTGEDELLFYRAYILHGATTRYRTDLLSKLLPLGLSFFGDPEGWKRIFGQGIRAYPDVNYYHETPSVYASSAVNLNATSLQMPRGVNQRVFDVPICGGFLLTDSQEDLFELFAEDELATYKDSGDAAEKAKYYLDHSSERSGILSRARSRVLGEHTYRHRMGQMLAAVFGA